MASHDNFWLEHKNKAFTIGTLKRVLASMTWVDLEWVANELDQIRRGELNVSQKAFKAQHIQDWLENE